MNTMRQFSKIFMPGLLAVLICLSSLDAQTHTTTPANATSAGAPPQFT